MSDFFPFIHEPKRKELEPEPLYVELHIPPPEYKKPIVEEDSYEGGVIIIQL
jgi:hypothetical protein